MALAAKPSVSALRLLLALAAAIVAARGDPLGQAGLPGTPPPAPWNASGDAAAASPRLRGAALQAQVGNATLDALAAVGSGWGWGEKIWLKNSHSGMAMCTRHNSEDPARQGNQEPIIQYQYYGDATQHWQVVHLSSGEVWLRNAYTGLALSTLHNAADPALQYHGEPMIQYQYYGDATQRWLIVQLGNGRVWLKNAKSGSALCTKHNSADPLNQGNQEPLIQYMYYGDSTQQWEFVQL